MGQDALSQFGTIQRHHYFLEHFISSHFVMLNEFYFTRTAYAAAESRRQFLKGYTAGDLIGGITESGIINPSTSGTFKSYYRFSHYASPSAHFYKVLYTELNLWLGLRRKVEPEA
jgi:hypothetical protein